MEKVHAIQANYELMRGRFPDDPDDKVLREEKNREILALKFITTVCNRIIYHITNPE